MTHTKICLADDPAALVSAVNAFAEQIESQQDDPPVRVKEVQYAIHPITGQYTALIVWGNGPVTTHVFQRAMRE